MANFELDSGVPTSFGIHVMFGKLIKVNSGPPLSVDIIKQETRSRLWCKKPVRCGSSCPDHTKHSVLYRRHATDRAYLGFKWFSTRWVKPFFNFFLKLYLVNEM